MPRFTHATQKYDSIGRKIPKGKGLMELWRKENPTLEVFDSKAEYETWLKLKAMENAGLIQNLRRQVPFELTKPLKWFNNVTNKMTNILKMEYVCDFVFERDGKTVCLDTKGWKLKKDKKTGQDKWESYTTEEYKLKKKFFLEKYPEYIFEES